MCLFHEKIMATRGVRAPVGLNMDPSECGRFAMSCWKDAQPRRRVVSLTPLLFFSLPPSFFSLRESMMRIVGCYVGQAKKCNKHCDIYIHTHI